MVTLVNLLQLSENLIHQTTAKNLWFGCGFSFLKKNFYNQKPNVFWWLNQPIWKICASQIGSSSLVGFRNKNCFKPPPGKLNDLHITNARFPAIRFTVAEDKTNPSRWSTTCRLLRRPFAIHGISNIKLSKYIKEMNRKMTTSQHTTNGNINKSYYFPLYFLRDAEGN